MKCKSDAPGIPAKIRSVFCVLIAPVLVVIPLTAQVPAKSEFPVTDSPRTHRRITQTEVPGRRVQLKSLNGAQLFVGPDVDPKRRVPLIIHFHGVAWLIETHISRSLPQAALITVNLGAGSSVYGRPFERENAFTELIVEAERELGLRKGWSSITLIGFSAGYGSIRAILRNERSFALVDNVLLLDGIHADYVSEGRPLAQGSVVDPIDVDAFVKFAAEAAKGRKNFVITHSAIVPGSYASTTECVDHLLERVKVNRKRIALNGPGEMQQLSRADNKGFRVRGYAGETASDHVDHLHEMPEWFRLLGLKH
jgi:hypothetical protein